MPSTRIVNVFAAAFADVSENFTHLFETLFPGGSGRLRLTDPQNLLGPIVEDRGEALEARTSGSCRCSPAESVR
ncbi:MAG: hypothetical protein R2716_06365 [Microthrixaceae bacterium]